MKIKLKLFDEVKGERGMGKNWSASFNFYPAKRNFSSNRKRIIGRDLVNE